MSLEALKTRIKENKLSGVFLFCGPEEYTKDHYASRIRKKVELSPLPEFNHLFFNAASGDLRELVDAIDSVPYMWDCKLIEITDLETARITESDIEDYERIFADVPDYVTILAVLRNGDYVIEDNKDKDKENGSKPRKSGLGAFINTVKEHGLVVEFDVEKADKLVTWITRHFNAHDVKFDSNVPREIINVCGSDMYVLQSEIAKLIEVFSGSPLTVKDVKQYCCANNAFKYFDIASALNRRDMVTAKKVFYSLDISKEEIPYAIGYLAKNYSEMLLVKTALDSGKGYDVIAKDTKIPQWRVGKIAQSVYSVDLRTLSYAISQLSGADVKIKSFRGNPHRILELAFYRICTYGRKA